MVIVADSISWPLILLSYINLSYIACRVWTNLPPQVREASNLKKFIAKLRELNLVQDEWFTLGILEGGWGREAKKRTKKSVSKQATYQC